MLETVLNSLIWASAATLISQGLGIALMWWLGLKPKQLAHEIENVQNTAVGASFFIISLISALFIGVMSASPAPAETILGSWLWIIGGVLLATIYTLISFAIAYRVMERIEGESLYSYIKREIIDEQNAALAFFLGGLAVAAYISVAAQVI